MTIYVNEVERHCSTSISLLKWITVELESTKGIAVAVNRQIIPKSEWSTTALKDKDALTIITATQGG